MVIFIQLLQKLISEEWDCRPTDDFKKLFYLIPDVTEIETEVY